MPPKPQVFKSPDGKEFTVKTEYRDYMMNNFFSFKNKVNEPEPLVRLPGSIDGQMYDISDCENSTLLVLDHSEQVQIDQCKNCRIFVAACASSIFIRNCEGCTFYTACRQLRLREAINCTFYIYSMSEVHIEYSNGLKFAPFNGGYPDHEKHLRIANLDIKNNLWYDIYDHNDSAKTRQNWSLLPVAEYEEPWFPLGPCTPAVPRTLPGGVPNSNNPGGDMQSFSLQQMMEDAKKLELAGGGKSPVKTPPAATSSSGTVPPPLPAMSTADIPSAPPASKTAACCEAEAEQAGQVVAGASSAQDKIKIVLQAFVGYQAGEDLSIMSTGCALSFLDMSAAAPITGDKLWTMERLHVCPSGHFAFASYWATEGGAESGKVVHCTAVLQPEPASPLDGL